MSQDAIVKVGLSSICGSDMHPYAGRGVQLDHGITFGHEFMGTVAKIGDQVSHALCTQSVRSSSALSMPCRLCLCSQQCMGTAPIPQMH